MMRTVERAITLDEAEKIFPGTADKLAGMESWYAEIVKGEPRRIISEITITAVRTDGSSECLHIRTNGVVSVVDIIRVKFEGAE